MIELDFSFAGVTALVIALTQLLKNKLKLDEKFPDKKLPKQILSLVVSILCCGLALLMGHFYETGMFADFQVNSFKSWFDFVIKFILCTISANGLWSYDFIRSLGVIKLPPKVEETETDNDETY
jgi:hypothetical protein